MMNETLKKIFKLRDDNLISWDSLNLLEYMKWYDLDTGTIGVNPNRFIKLNSSIPGQMFLKIDLQPHGSIEKHYHDFKQNYMVVSGSVTINSHEINEGEDMTVFGSVEHYIQAGPSGANLICELIKSKK